MIEVNHIGITVGNLEAAVTLYRSVFDLEVLVAPQTATLETAASARRRDVFGPRWGGMRVAHLATKSGGIGIELFEFTQPATISPEVGFEYWKCGVSHICFTVDDLEHSISKLTSFGGRKRSQIHTVWPGTRICYCEDPWGVVLELSSRDYHHIAGLKRIGCHVEPPENG
jgi:catechol 2,3-dioxygenase-like lactoylglutathione lyase family enzyme